MKFFSLSNIYDNAAESMRRFYMPLFCAVAGAILSIALVESTSEKAEDVIPGMILTCVLTMNFSFGGMLYVERRKNKSMEDTAAGYFNITGAHLLAFRKAGFHF